MKAIICSKARPNLGSATIPLPIPDDEYTHHVELLEQMQICGVTASDCYVVQINGAPLHPGRTGEVPEWDRVEEHP